MVMSDTSFVPERGIEMPARLTVKQGEAYDNGDTLVQILNDHGLEVGSLVIAPTATGGVSVEVWQYADDNEPIETVTIPHSKGRS